MNNVFFNGSYGTRSIGIQDFTHFPLGTGVSVFRAASVLRGQFDRKIHF